MSFVHEKTHRSCYSDNFDDDRRLVHDNTVALFKKIAAGKYEAFTSTYVTDELDAQFVLSLKIRSFLH